ncbi:hypothetical protein HDU98_011919, partial [Podochytrium sp. JEL0797]
MPDSTTTATTTETDSASESTALGLKGLQRSSSRSDFVALQFVTKLVATCVRYRGFCAGSAKGDEDTAAKGVAALGDDAAFWAQRMPLHVDVCGRQALCERWVLAYEHQPSLAPSSSASELILLSQALYSHIRLLPLHPILHQTKTPPPSMGDYESSHLMALDPAVIVRVATADGRLLSCSEIPSSDSYASDLDNHLHTFSPTAKLRAYRFKSAATPQGILHLSVVYDAGVSKDHVILSSRSKSLNRNQDSAFTNPSSYTSPGSMVGSASGSANSLTGAMRRMHLAGSPGSSTSFTAAPIPIVRLDENGTEVVEELQPMNQESYTTPHAYPHSSSTNNSNPNHQFESSSDDEYDSDLDDLQKPTNAPSDNLRRENSSESLHANFKSAMSLNNSTLSPRYPSAPASGGFSFTKTAITTTATTSSGVSNFSTTPPVRPFQSLSASYTQHLTPTNGNLPRSSVPSSAPYHPANLDLLSGSLIGSYEESILSGRMSSLPSKPLPFIAEIGCVAMGKCKNPALQCPKGLKLGFDACFYEFGGSKAEAAVADLAGGVEFEGVSPYVGNVDVEGLSGMIWEEEEKEEEVGKEGEDGEEGFRKKWIGGWRVPTKGQLQIIIKNPAGTAVKIYLLPYDFRDMPPNTKTFLRQKIYVVKSQQPSSLSLPSTSTPSTTRSPSSTSSKDRLRDAIHVHFQFTSRKRLYVTRQIRVVFGHKGVESDEKCRVVTEGPRNPKYIVIPMTSSSVVSPAGWTTTAAGLSAPKHAQETLSVSPSRRSLSTNAGLMMSSSPHFQITSPGGSAMGIATPGPGSLICSATASASTPNSGLVIPRRSSLGVSMMHFAGVNLDHPTVPLLSGGGGGSGVGSGGGVPVPQQLQRALSASRSMESFRRPSALQHHSSTAEDFEEGESSSSASTPPPPPATPQHDLLFPPRGSAGPLFVGEKGKLWMAPPSNKSSLSIALSMSGSSGSVSSSGASSGATTPKGMRSRNVSAVWGEVEGVGGSMLKREVLDEVRME